MFGLKGAVMNGMLRLSLVCAVSGCFLSTAVRPTVTVDLSTTYQTIRGFGGNAAYVVTSFKLPAVVDSVMTQNLRDLRPTHLRLFFPLDAWEPIQGVRQETAEIQKLFLILQQQKQAGRTLVLTVVQIAPWMGVYDRTWNGFDMYRIETQQQISNVAESFAQALVRLRDVYGVTVDYVSFNETRIGFQVRLSPLLYRDLVKTAGTRFSQLGLTTKWLVGDDLTASLIEDAYATPTLGDAAAASYAGPIAYHSYEQENSSGAQLLKIAALGRTYGREVWATEVGLPRSGITYPDRGTWANAYRLAVNYHRSIKFAGSTTLLYWQLTHDNRHSLVDYDTLTPYPTFWIVKQYRDHFLPGSQIARSVDHDARVHSLAAKNVAGNTFTVQLLVDNTGASKQATIAGLPNGSVTLTQTSSGQIPPVTVGTFTVVNNTLTLALPPWSVNIMTGSLGTASSPGVTGQPGPSAAFKGAATGTVPADEWRRERAIFPALSIFSSMGPRLFRSMGPPGPGPSRDGVQGWPTLGPQDGCRAGAGGDATPFSASRGVGRRRRRAYAPRRARVGGRAISGYPPGRREFRRDDIDRIIRGVRCPSARARRASRSA